RRGQSHRASRAARTARARSHGSRRTDRGRSVLARQRDAARGSGGAGTRRHRDKRTGRSKTRDGVGGRLRSRRGLRAGVRVRRTDFRFLALAPALNPLLDLNLLLTCALFLDLHVSASRWLLRSSAPHLVFGERMDGAAALWLGSRLENGLRQNEITLSRD